MKAYRLIIIVAAVLLTACGDDVRRRPQITGARVAEVVWADDYAGADDTAVLRYPSHIDLEVGVDNGAGRIKITEGRLRVSYNGRRVVMFTLERAVTIPPRSASEVTLPLRVNVARNAALMPLQQALRRADLSDVQVEWDLKVRAGVYRGVVRGGPVAVEQSVEADVIEVLLRASESFMQQQPSE